MSEYNPYLRKLENNSEWRKKQCKTISIVIYKEDYDEYAAYVKSIGKTPGEDLRDHISACIGRPLTKKRSKK